ncbi:MAG: PD-(D/E)XK nuclease family protein, partial [Flavobacteriaceae bacterium]|nr:PD-(D/E)XK nuclease family protein [Flavobacteriaceae bacterium]
STINIENTNEEILKTPATVFRLKEFAKKGFSPSSLSNYIKEPEEFYYKNLLNLHDNEEKEEISPRLIGIVFHESLESLYKPFIKKVILKKDLLAALNNINYYVQKSFKKNIIDFKKGKGLIAFEVVKKAIDTLIRIELKDIERGNKIEILALEKKMECEIDLKTIKSPVKLTGVIDRLDRRNGVVRIIDYKTGLIKPNEVVVKNLEDCFNKTNLKSMQLMCYVLMYFKNSSKVLKSEAAIISLRDLNKGLINFGVKESSTKTDYIIDKDKIKIFEKKINELVLEIMDPNIPFVKNS